MFAHTPLSFHTSLPYLFLNILTLKVEVSHWLRIYMSGEKKAFKSIEELIISMWQRIEKWEAMNSHLKMSEPLITLNPTA